MSPSLHALWEHWYTQFPPHSTRQAVHEHTQPGVLKPELRLVLLNSREDSGLSSALWVNLGKGGDFYFSAKTVGINKSGHVPRLPLQLLSAERDQSYNAFEVSHHSHFFPVQANPVCVALSSMIVYLVSVLTLLVLEVGRKLLCYYIGPF